MTQTAVRELELEGVDAFCSTLLNAPPPPGPPGGTRLRLAHSRVTVPVACHSLEVNSGV